MCKKKTTEQFIEDAKLVHGDKYDYSLVEYRTAKEKIKIVCKEHGEFEQSATHHLVGGSCKKCSLKIKNFGRKTTIEFINDAIKIHDNNYDYSLVEYTDWKTKVKVICNLCKNIFEISPNNHKNGKGCKECGIKRRTKKLSHTKEIFIEKANIKHNNFYNYDKVEYTNSSSKVIIGCPIHGDFEQEANSHIYGTGCPKCSLDCNTYRRSHYIKLSETATLYLISVYNNEESFYKIGKTINEVKKRFPCKEKLPYNYTIIKEYKSNIEEIYDLEIELHRKYKDFKYLPKINFKGYTECYRTDLPIQEIINLGCQNI